MQAEVKLVFAVMDIPGVPHVQSLWCFEGCIFLISARIV
jgi:hypothetical protein